MKSTISKSILKVSRSRKCKKERMGLMGSFFLVPVKIPAAAFSITWSEWGDLLLREGEVRDDVKACMTVSRCLVDRNGLI